MFSPEDSIGIEATNYLLDLGFIFSVDSAYVGELRLDLRILKDDGHPEHAAVLDEFLENSETHIHCTMEQHRLEINWSNAEIISISADFPPKILSTFKAFLENDDSIVYISNEKLVEMQEKLDSKTDNQD